MNGTAGEAVLPQLLGDIYLGRKSGILQLIREGSRLALFFREGRVLRVGDRENGPPAVIPAPDDTLSLRLNRVLRLLSIATESLSFAKSRSAAAVNASPGVEMRAEAARTAMEVGIPAAARREGPR